MVATSLRFVEKFISLPKERNEITLLGKRFAREFFDVKTISDLLTRQGFEVEGCTERGLGLETVVVGRIVSAEPHPNASKLRVCRVDVGEENPRQIVCGAPNARNDLFVAVALPGSKLPAAENKFLEIKPSSIRGVDSFGMLCSRAELSLPVNAAVDGDGIWELAVDGQAGKPAHELATKLGQPVFDALSMRDAILEINVLANRPDLRSHLGVARELEAGFRLNGIPFERRSCSFVRSLTESNLITQAHDTKSLRMQNTNFSVRNSLGVGAFFVLMENLTVEVTPGWLRDLLEGLGQNSVNAIVDASNFILLAYGQPSHAFDFAKLNAVAGHPSNKEIILRMAKEGEKFHGLDGKERVLTAKDCVVADPEIPQAILGVIGGELSKVDSTTKAIAIEFANAHPVAVRRSSRRHGRLTESSMAFEKGIDAAARFDAACELVGLIETLSPTSTHIVGALHSQLEAREGEAQALISDKYVQAKLGPAEGERIAVDFSALARLPDHPLLEKDGWKKYVTSLIKEHRRHLPSDCQSKILGTDLVSFDKALEILSSLGFVTSSNRNEKQAEVESPHWRWHDITNVPDLVEEIARLVGIDSVPEVPLVSAGVLAKDDAHVNLIEKTVARATQVGYIEVAGLHFMREDEMIRMGLPHINALGEPLALLNPIIRDEPLLHTSLIPDLLRKVSRNIAYGTKSGQLCHLCRTYQNQSSTGQRVFPENGSMVGMQEKLAEKQAGELHEYSPQHALAYSREKDQEGRPAETPRLSGVVFGERQAKSWQNSESVAWDLHAVMAHVVEICRSIGVRVEVSDLPGNHPFAPALHPGRRTAVKAMVGGSLQIVGWIGQLHPKTLRAYDIDGICIGFELNLKRLVDSAQQISQTRKKVIVPRRFPNLTRDFAFLLSEEITAERLIATVSSGLNSLFSSGDLPAKLAKIEIFDLYRGRNIPEGKKSIAIGITIEPMERTFNDSEIQRISQAVVSEVTEKIGGELRS